MRQRVQHCLLYSVKFDSVFDKLGLGKLNELCNLIEGMRLHHTKLHSNGLLYISAMFIRQKAQVNVAI